MTVEFDPGYCKEPFRTLCTNFPGPDTYPSSRFRIEWGPIFHRGRLDGTARLLVIGQDPAQHEATIRRILVGEAGRRVQGLMAKLGITRSYVMINTFLYSVYGGARVLDRRNEQLVGYRNSWLDAIIDSSKIEAVIALGKNADEAWKFWKETASGSSSDVAYVPLSHPTAPESASRNDRTKLAEHTKKMFKNWNEGLQYLASAVKHPDEPAALMPYGESFKDSEKPRIPDFDFPAGIPSWMQETDGWARRVGKTDIAKRRNITLTVPKPYMV
jgi:uracil-DNA glycosylase